MKPNYWQKIEEIFQVAVELPSREEREVYLNEVCGEDEDLRIEVEHLLRQDEEADSLLSEPLLDNSGLHIFASMIEERDPTIGREIGAYRVMREIGRGGMGAVYLAERADGLFKQQVAIKIIKRGMDTDFVLRRFRRERQILANLNHPFIARLLDGGTTDDDLPFFVMEYIEGKSLYKYADANTLSIAERLKLFRQVCEAIEFAHQNQIVHRDIKPSNILVTADGVPKLLDFGIAKVLGAEANIYITVEPTATAVRMMTPEYASPEQVSGLPITPASDIYSLGVLLYEFITGHRPYRFKNRAPHEIARVICEEEPEKPSTSITQNENLLPTGASEATTLIDVCLFRGAENMEDLRRELKGDLEKIILKTLRKNAAERYQTATALAADISRYLEGENVSAESFSVTSAPEKIPPQIDGVKSLAILPLKILNLSPNIDTTGDEFLSIGLADAMITRLSGIRRLAVRPTSAILDYEGDLVNPLQAGKDLSVDFVLDGRIKILGKKIRVTLQLLDVKKSISVWANQFNEIFTDALELEDKISEKVAEVLLPELTTTEKDRIKKQGTENAEAFDAYLRGRFFWNKFTPEFLPKSLELFQRAVALDPNYALAFASLADYYNWAGIYGILPTEESAPKAKAAALRALEIDSELAEAMAAYALTMSSVDWNFAEAEKLYLRAIEIHPNFSLAYEWYAALLVGTGRFDEGVEMIHRSEKANPLSLRAMTLTAWTLYQAGRFSEAAAKAEKIAQLDRNFPQAYIQLANALPHIGRTREAVAAAEQADRMMPNTVLVKYVLCYALVADGRREEARKVLLEAEKLNREQYVKPFFMAMVYSALDEGDKAYEYFVKAFDEHDQWLNWFGTDSKLEKIRREPRFIELFRRMKNPLAKKLTVAEIPKTSGEKSIAVLPLKIIGTINEEDTGSEFLSIGLADALITRLSNVRRFAV
ncbi:MAG TPA: protein kinase, partial [Pyrinomonadaceae bacterium]|nr:protein kinase [Pyrinomonadaceae bacterium]